MQANEARRRSAGLHGPTAVSRSPFIGRGSRRSSGDGLSNQGEGSSDKRAARRGGGSKAAPSASVFWSLLLGLFGVLLLWMTWRLGASIYVSLPRLHLANHQAPPDGPAPPSGDKMSPCRLQDGYIVPAQGPCSIQAILDDALSKAAPREAVEAAEGPGGDAPAGPFPEVDDSRIHQEDDAPDDDPEETMPVPDQGQGPKDTIVETLVQEAVEAAEEPHQKEVQDMEEPLEAAEEHQEEVQDMEEPLEAAEEHQEERRQRSHKRPDRADRDPNVPDGSNHQQTERERAAQEQWEQKEKTQKDMERRFAERKRIHADTNRKRAAMGLSPLPPLRAPWEVNPNNNNNNRQGPHQMPQDPRGEPEMTPEDFAWVSQMSIVISWVNGSEPEYAKKRAQFGTDKVNTSRDRDSGELLHALQSIERYMAWHTGKIFIVSPNQKPSWLDTHHHRVKVIDQDDLVPKECQPTFSSNVLEQHLHRIPGLTETFIYWNDDYFLGRSVMPEDFVRFDKGGPRRLMLFMLPGRIGGGAEKVQSAANGPRKWYATLYNTNGILNAAYDGHDPGRTHIAHAPYVFHKRAYEKIHEKWAEALNHTCHNKFRHWSDVLFPYLHHYYVIHEGSKCCGIHYQIKTFAHQGKEEFKFVILNNNKTQNSLALKDLRMTRPKFFTLNDGFRNPEVGFGQLTPFLATMSNGYRSSFERLIPGGDNRPGHEYKNYAIRAQNYHKEWLARQPNRTAAASNRTAEMMARRVDARRQEIPGNKVGIVGQKQRRFEMMRRAQERMQQANNLQQQQQQQQQKGPGGQQGPGTGGLGPGGDAPRQQQQQQQHPNHALRKGRAFQGPGGRAMSPGDARQQQQQQPQPNMNPQAHGRGGQGPGVRGMGPGGNSQQAKPQQERPDERFSKS